MRSTLVRLAPAALVVITFVLVTRTPGQLGHEFTISEEELPGRVADWTRVPVEGTIPIVSADGRLRQGKFGYEREDGTRCEIILAVSQNQGSQVFRRFLSSYEVLDLQVGSRRIVDFPAPGGGAARVNATWVDFVPSGDQSAACAYWYATRDRSVAGYSEQWRRRIIERLMGRQQHWAVVYMLFTAPGGSQPVPADVAALATAIADVADQVLESAPGR